MTTELNTDDIWKIIDAHFNYQGLVKHQINSYHDFVKKIVPTIVTSQPPMEFVTPESHKMSIKFETAYFGLPQHQESSERKYQVDDKDQRRTYSTSYTTMYPNDCRVRQLTYEAPLYSDVSIIQEVWNPTTNSFVPDKKWNYQIIIAWIPVMVRSDLCLLSQKVTMDSYIHKECVYDQGGYFIIHGGERVLIAQERIGNNYIYVFNIKNKLSAEIRSISEATSKSISILYLKVIYDKVSNEPLLYWNTPTLKKPIPLFTLFFAYGIFDRAQIYALCGGSTDPDIVRMLQPNEEESFAITTRQEAYNEIINRMTNLPKDERKQLSIDKFLSHEILPHVSNTIHPDKPAYLGMIVHKLCLVLLKRLSIDDRDHYGFKRLDLSAFLLSNIFRQSFQKMLKTLHATIKRNFERKLDKNFSFDKDFGNCEKIIGKDIGYCLSTGNWVINKQSKNIKTGVSQNMKRLAYMESLSYLRRINAPLQKEGKNPKPRQLHNSQFGIICCAETPEGEGCGLTKTLAIMTDLSVERDPYVLREFIQYNAKVYPQLEPSIVLQPVFINGFRIGFVEQDFNLRTFLIDARRNGLVPHDISIIHTYYDNSIHLQTDAGRVIRPLFTVTNNQVQITKDDLFKLQTNAIDWPYLIGSGKVEYIDTLEAENALIAVSFEQLRERAEKEAIDGVDTEEPFTHCEIHPAMIIGVCASIIPMANHNQSPRNCYESSMCKQSMSIYAMNYQYRFDTIAHVLCYPQKPLTPTKSMKYIGFEDMPAGQNIIAAIACFTGYNQEDSVLLNKAAIQRGMFRSLYYKSTYDVECSKSHIDGEMFCKPDPNVVDNKSQLNYNKIDSNGVPEVGAVVKQNDVLIGKIQPLKTTQEQQFISSGSTITEPSKFTHRDISVTVKSNQEGIVDAIAVSDLSENGKQLIKVKIRQVRIPEVGDKFASCNGQKGTCGLIVAQEDMPYTTSGITPDLILNVHAIPSRMTIGQLLECVMSKTRCVTGLQSTSTAFEASDIESVAAQLHEAGFEKYGKELMYHPATGRQMEALIFIGPTYYQRLKHMVADKVSSFFFHFTFYPFSPFLLLFLVDSC